MFKGEEIQAIETLDTMTTIIKSELENITDGFISVGYHLKKTRDDELYKQKGYQSIFEYARDTFGISRFTATRFMEINDKYSIGGNSPQIDDRWKGYGSSKLTEMLGLPEEVKDAIPVEATVREIREARAIVKETESHYEDQMELCDIAQKPESEPWMRKLVRQFFEKEGKDKFQSMVDFVRKDIGNDRVGIEEDLLAIVNPTKFKMIQLDTARVMLQEKAIRVMPFRGQGEPQEYSYIDFDMAFEELFYPNYPDVSQPINEVYRAVYGIPYYEEKERDSEPKKPEKKVDKKPEQKGEITAHDSLAVSPGEKTAENPRHLGNTRAPEISEEEKTEEKEPKVAENNDQIPRQTEITKDFPEYCPEDMKNNGENEQENQGSENQQYLGNTRTPGAYTIRKTYLTSLPDEEASAYMAAVMEEKDQTDVKRKLPGTRTGRILAEHLVG